MNNTEKKSFGGNPLVYLFKKTWHYSEGNRKNVAIFWTMFVTVECIEVLVNPMIWAGIMNTIQEKGVGGENIRILMWFLTALLISTVITWCLHGPARLMERKNGFLAKLNYRKHLLKGVMMFPMDWHTNHHSGDTIDKIEKGTNGLNQFADESFEVIYAIVRLVASYSMLAYFYPPSSYMVLIMLAITIGIVIKFDKILIEQYKRLNKIENEISANVFDAISNITTVIILRVERLVFNAIIKKAESPYELFKRNNYLNEIKWFLTAVCCTITVIVVMGSYFMQNYGAKGGILIGSVYLLSRYLENITQIFYRFASMYSDIVRRRARVANSEELASEFKEESFANHVLPANWKSLEIKGLNFSYNGDVGLHLDDISLSINHGERIAFVGRSGSGKTTLLKVMRGLYKPSSLTLTVDGAEISQGFEGISRAIALIPQSPEIFSTTIWGNLTLGAEYEESFVRRLTDIACFTEVAMALPKKFESSVTEKGVNLSGGQQQRLALARGLLACHDKDIALLDEPTASLDAVTERQIYGNIFREFVGKTVVSSIHRLHLLPYFDRVCMFEDGKIVGLGTFDQLLVGCPQFAELWRQYGGESDNNGNADQEGRKD